jgi:tRNA 2-selenouridine synthase
MSLITPPDFYLPNAGRPAFQLLDVRAPLEVAKGAMPYSVFEPILTNEERHQVGLCYKENGQQAAIDLGYALTAPYLASRIESWRKTCDVGPTAVACWRGGLRSKLTSDFIARAEVPRVEGGYKALRNYVVSQLAPVLASKRVIVLAGLTGSGKTKFLKSQMMGNGHQTFDQSLKPETQNLSIIDLEAEAHHRGSAFGSLDQQPSQATFENSVATKILLSTGKNLLLEDESRGIGAVSLPEGLYKTMSLAPLIILEAPLAERVQNIFEEYVSEATRQKGQEATRQTLEGDLLKLYQRLGWETVRACVESLDAAQNSGHWLEPSSHAYWITTLLTGYYDPLYQKSLGRSGRPVLFRGDYQECQEFLKSLTA